MTISPTKKVALIAVGATLVFSSLLAILISELIISRLYPQNTYKIAQIGVVNVFAKSTFLPFELRPGAKGHHIAPTHEYSNDLTINSQGYRGPEFEQEKKEGTVRVLMLGDSTTFGIGSEDDQTFSVDLENLFRQEERSVEVINAGFASGLSPDTYYVYLKEKGLKLKPDIVFANLFLSNDITDLFENRWPETDEHGYPIRVESVERQIDRQGRLVFRQKDWKYRIPLVRDMHVGILTLNLIEQKFPKLETLIRWLVNAQDLLPDIPKEEKETCLYLTECSERFEEQYRRLTLIFKGFKELSDRSGVPIVITLMPPQFQLTARPESEEMNNNLSVSIPTGEETNQNYPQKRLIAMLESVNLGYFDLLKSLRENLNPQIANDYVYQDDQHYTPKGNEAIGQAYFKYLKSQTNLFP